MALTLDRAGVTAALPSAAAGTAVSAMIRIRGLTKRFGSFTALKNISLDVARGQFVCFLGPSGCGKTTLLRAIAGLDFQDEGTIEIAGRDVSRLPPAARDFGIVFQSYALFPNLSVADNVGYGLVNRGATRAATLARVRELLALVGLPDQETKYPVQLSGGQQQRVALARALARRSRLLLLDEPFSALDDSLRNAMRRELLRLRTELGLTILFVTHDLREAHFLADRIAVFDGGRVLQLGTRDEVFRRPASRRVGELTGVANIWNGVVTASDSESVTVDVEGALLRALPAGVALAPGERVDVMVRAERVNLRRDMQASSSRRNTLPASIVAEFAYGSSHVLQMQPEGAGPRIEVEIAARPYEVLGIPGRRLFNVEIDPADIHLVPASPSVDGGGKATG